MKSLFILFVIVFLASITSFSYAESEREDSHEGYEHQESREYRTVRVLSTKTTKKKVVTKKSVKKPVINKWTGTTQPAKNSTGTTTQSATVSYWTPEGNVSVGFSVAIKWWIITDASSTKKASGTSVYYQESFARWLSQAVVGKKVADLNLGAIGGASLTTAAFEKFIKQ